VTGCAVVTIKGLRRALSPVGPAGEKLSKFSRLVVITGTLAGLAGFGGAAHADAAAGKATFTDVCSECHEVADFEGESTADVQGTIKKIVAGTQKHKKALKLTDAQIADVAAYMTGGK
jgi:mono/diheme cytochrome c family protein